jgi:hypothetical protein
VHPHHQVLELVFLMVILKIPIAYLCYVVYYAIKAKPVPPAGAAVTARVGPEDPQPRLDRRRRFPHLRPRPHGGPVRTYPRTARAALAASRARR